MAYRNSPHPVFWIASGIGACRRCVRVSSQNYSGVAFQVFRLGTLGAKSNLLSLVGARSLEEDSDHRVASL